jgi:hypothetical protein
MNVYVGKIGKSILFNRDSWGNIGGDCEAPKYYENLFARNPSITFYLLGCNDFSRLSSSEKQRINANGNVVDIWGKQFVDWKKNNPMDSKLHNIEYLKEYVALNHVKFDAGVVFTGPTGTTNIPFKVTKMRNPSEVASPLEMLCKYVAPMTDWMNDNRHIPYILIVNDPRFWPPNARDWIHMPTIVLSQYDEDTRVTVRKNYTDNETVVHTIPSTYSAMETIFLIGQDKEKQSAETETSSLDTFFGEDIPEPAGIKDINFMIVLNEGRPSRYNLLKETILNHVQDVAIYGKWDERTIGTDSRFKGSLPFHELQSMLPRVKYTYCIPIKKGWVTMKFWEMAHYGIIPFLHPTYDEQNHLNAPQFLRVKDSKDLFDKIAYLESNPDAYTKLRDTLDTMLKPSYYSGEHLNDVTLAALNKITGPGKVL